MPPRHWRNGLKQMLNPVHKIHVDLVDKPYNIYIGVGALAYLRDLYPETKSHQFIIFGDEHTLDLYADQIHAVFNHANDHIIHTASIKGGEDHKNLQNLLPILDDILKAGITRRTILIALGGGIVGDMGGFCASILLRGIDFVQIPTTLLAQIDSSVGGKTGVNSAAGKNLIGAFYQPRAVYIDPAMLQTLDIRERRAGYAEMVKYAFINQADFFDYLEQSGQAIIALNNPEIVAQSIARCCRAKAEIVIQDENEQNNIRALLNFGHSFGHALEGIGRYDGRILHGEAVAIGMMMAFAYSVHLGICPVEDYEKAKSHLKQMGLMTHPHELSFPKDITADAVMHYLYKDKKAQHKKIILILARAIGQVFVAEDIDPDHLKSFLENYLSC